MRSPLNQRGSSILEVVLAVSLFGVVGLLSVQVLMTSLGGAKQGIEYVTASALHEEAAQGMRSIRNQDFSLLTNGDHGLTVSGGAYALSGTSDSPLGGKYARTITVSDVYRNGGSTGNIASSGVLDSFTKQVDITTTWTTLTGKIKTLASRIYLSNLAPLLTWIQTAYTDFTAGSRNSTSVQTESAGEVVLRALDADWNPISSVSTVNIAGTGNVAAFHLDTGADVLYAFSQNTSGNEVSAYNVQDVSETTPTLRSLGMDLGGPIADTAVVSNGYAYIATATDTSEIVVVKLSTMTQVNTVNITGAGDAKAVAITGTTLIVGRASTSDAEVYYFDITTPEGTITQVGSTEIGGDVNDVVTDGTYAYLATASNTAELTVVRLSTYASVATLDMTGTNDAMSLERSGTDLFMGRVSGSGNPDFLRVSIATPTAPTLTSSATLAVQTNDISFDPTGAYAFLATSGNTQEVTVVAISSMAMVSTLDTTGTGDGMAITMYGSHIFIGTQDDTVEITVARTNEGGWAYPALQGSQDATRNYTPSAIYVSANRAYVGSSSNASTGEFFVYDITTPTAPTYLGNFETGATVNDIVVSGNYAYIASSDNSRELDILDISTPSAITRAGVLNLTGSQDAVTLALSGTTAYVGRTTGAGKDFYVIDVTTASAPVESGSVNTAATVNETIASGNYVYAATSKTSAEFTIFDVSSPSSPSVAGVVDLTGTAIGRGVALSGSTVVVTRASSSNNEVNVIDVSNPSAPTLSGSADAGAGAYGVVLDGASTAYIATDLTSAQWQRWSLVTPSAPTRLATFNLGATGYDLYWDGTNTGVVTGDTTKEFQIIGQGTVPAGYVTDGSFTSQVYDSGSSGTDWSSISWTASGTGTINFRIRTASSSAGLETATWVGSDGTINTTYDTMGQAITTDPSATGTQYIQWKAYLTGDGSTTPQLEDVTLQYE